MKRSFVSLQGFSYSNLWLVHFHQCFLVGEEWKSFGRPSGCFLRLRSEVTVDDVGVRETLCTTAECKRRLKGSHTQQQQRRRRRHDVTECIREIKALRCLSVSCRQFLSCYTCCFDTFHPVSSSDATVANSVRHIMLPQWRKYWFKEITTDELFLNNLKVVLKNLIFKTSSLIKFSLFFFGCDRN